MRKSILFCLIIFFAYPVPAQYITPPDKSPMDMAYFPDNFAHDRKEGDKAIIRVTYSRPQKKGRNLFGELIPYGKVWRTGANEATEIKVYHDIKIGDNTLEEGTYSLFTVPGKDTWEIIFNQDLDYWGAYSYNQAHDIFRVKANSEKTDQQVEYFTIQFESSGDSTGKMILAWGNTTVTLPFQY